MNTRLLVTARGWFGGGGDLTPMRPETAEAREDAADFHAAFRAACDATTRLLSALQGMVRPYFFCRTGEPRGAGGIFFDHLFGGDPAADLAFTRDVG